MNLPTLFFGIVLLACAGLMFGAGVMWEADDGVVNRIASLLVLGLGSLVHAMMAIGIWLLKNRRNG